jgi:large subunit ribosomal protein L20
MAKVKHATASHKRKKRVLKKAKGYWLDRSKRYRHAKEAVMKAQTYATRDRKAAKSEFRALWISRINAACKEKGLKYSSFIQALKKANIALDRKSLAELASSDAKAFAAVVEKAQLS